MEGTSIDIEVTNQFGPSIREHPGSNSNVQGLTSQKSSAASHAHPIMASTVTSDSLVYDRSRGPVGVERVHKYHWPAIQLNVWMLIMLIAACTIIGVFATFIDVQNTLLLPVPWYCLSPFPLPLFIQARLTNFSAKGTSPTSSPSPPSPFYLLSFS